jgi:hypothetical protein
MQRRSSVRGDYKYENIGRETETQKVLAPLKEYSLGWDQSEKL